MNEVLGPHKAFINDVDPDVLSMNDNACQNRAYVVSEYLQIDVTTRTDYPPYSPGLNPIIQHVCNALVRQLSVGQTHLPGLSRF
ncbi:hypothetical protein TNCT_616351 [Trichonephila clavata]|uniref:Tc1-like transposase DDE domain-containing protein n=1 Tax=Trichonephila clavata TaxID=2740835 RepID=A0A8X6FMK1_TRICU|nr:hypothetical protein TNCT_616351 [Trichonephila clavata]